MRATRSSSMRFTEPHGCKEEPLVRPHRSTRSSAPPPHTPWYSNGFIIMTEEEEEEEKLARLERGLWRTSTSSTKLSTYWVFIRDTEDGGNSLKECRQTPTRDSSGKS
jgi:hypothetical protein